MKYYLIKAARSAMKALLRHFRRKNDQERTDEDSRRPRLRAGVSVFLFLVIVGVVCLSFAACGSQEDRSTYINVFNWGEYIDESLLTKFEDETGIRVNYNTVSTCEEMYAKMKAGGVSYDIVVPSDYMVARMIEEGMVQKIDYDNVPNAQYVDQDFRNPDYDPTGEYSVPYQYGTVGIIYNKDMVDEKDTGSWDLLWNKKYAGQILMFDNSRDAMGIALKRMGYSYNTTDEDALYKAADMLKEQKPLVQAYVMDQIFDKMEGGEAAIAPYYTGDYYLMLGETDPAEVNLGYYVPREGSNLFVDAMVIPSDAGNKTGAEKFMNFICDPQNMAQNTEYICYSTAETAARNLLPDDMRDNEDMYPRGAELSRFEIYNNMPKNIRTLYDGLWVQVMSY